MHTVITGGTTSGITITIAITIGIITTVKAQPKF
jgi:hypothetical protein